MKLHWKILIALVLAVIAGLLTGRDLAVFGVSFFSAYDLVGTVFLNALKMLIVPLIMSSIITSMASIGTTDALGRLGGRTLVYYMTTSLLAILVGLIIVGLLTPGIIDGKPAKDVLGLSSAQAAAAEAKVKDRGAKDLAGLFLSIVPPNIFAAAAKGRMLGLIFFSLIFGYFLNRIENKEQRKTLSNLWQGVYAVMMKITDWVMSFAPIGVFGLVAKVVASVGPSEFKHLAQSLGVFSVCVLVALAIHTFVTLPLILQFVGRVDPRKHFRAMAPALLTAFSTASSAATLPMTFECVEKRAGVSRRTSSFVLPLGATMNMDGTALYECVAAMFIAQAYGIELSFATQFSVVLIALLTSVGVAAVPAASLVAITIILSAIGLPVEALGLILPVDRLLDMFRTSVNVFSDSCGAVVIARLEGVKALLV